MLRKLGLLVFVVVLSLVIAVPAFAQGPGGRPGSNVVVYVTSQDLYYDSIVGPDLPPKGPFQQLFPPGANPDYPNLTTLSTEFGPGTPGHHGGRWWVDENGNGEMDSEDHYFSCPLLGPGREEP